MTDIRKQIMAQIIAVIDQAEAQGQNSIAVAKARFAGTPDSVIYDAWSQWSIAQEDAWWQSMEKTIDGEIVRKALENQA